MLNWNPLHVSKVVKQHTSKNTPLNATFTNRLFLSYLALPALPGGDYYSRSGDLLGCVLLFSGSDLASNNISCRCWFPQMLGDFFFLVGGLGGWWWIETVKQLFTTTKIWGWWVPLNVPCKFDADILGFQMLRWPGGLENWWLFHRPWISSFFNFNTAWCFFKGHL